MMAALKRATEWSNNLCSKHKKFIDFEFGPNEDDEYGEKALYYDGVSPGGILPEDIIWLRPEQIS